MTEHFYSEQYIEQAFFLWHSGGRKISQRFANSLPEDETGKRPTFKTIEKWRDAYGWIERAEALDVEFSNALQTTAIDKRIRMYEEHVELSNALISKGKEFLETHQIEDMSDALKAITLGVEIQKASIGQVEMGRKILTMTDDQLTRELNKLLGKPDQESEFIDVTPEETDG